MKKSTKEANKKTLQILCEKIAPTEKTFGPHVDKEERSRHKESASVALKTIGVEGYSKEVSKEFWREVRAVLRPSVGRRE